MSYMSNLGEGIEEMGAQKTTIKIILNMYRKGYTSDQIAEIAEVSVEDVNEIIMNADAES